MCAVVIGEIGTGRKMEDTGWEMGNGGDDVIEDDMRGDMEGREDDWVMDEYCERCDVREDQLV